jgi:hypothetical protein
MQKLESQELCKCRSVLSASAHVNRSRLATPRFANADERPVLSGLLRPELLLAPGNLMLFVASFFNSL